MLRRILNKIISNLKNDSYELDKAIPGNYLFFFSCRKLRMTIRGLCTFCKKEGIVFIGKKVNLYCTSKISLGRGVTIDSYSYLDALSNKGIIIGENSSIGKYTIIECSGSIKNIGYGLKVGKNVSLGASGFFGCAGGIVVGDDTIMGNFVSFHSENHNYSIRDEPIRNQGVKREGIVIGDDCWIGAKATVLDGVIVENGCVIAAGALLTKGRYEAYGIYGGVPAKLIKFRKK